MVNLYIKIKLSIYIQKIYIIDKLLSTVEKPLIKKKISESIWSDIQDRSAGETVRKEDDVNNLDMNELYEHIYELYEQINPFPMPLKSLEDTSDKKTQYFSIPIFKTSYKVYRLDAIFKNDKISVLTLMTSDADIRDFKQALIDNFDVIIRADTALTIEEKDGTLTNQTCMKLISVIVENAPEPYLRKKGLNESIWSDLQDRSSGEVMRKEDDVNHLNFNDFFEYLASHYKPNNLDYEIRKSMDFMNVNHHNILIPIEILQKEPQRPLCKTLRIEYNIDNNHTYIFIGKSLLEKYPELENILSKVYDTVSTSRSIRLVPKDGEVTNNKIVKLIDVILGIVKEPLLKKIS